MMRRALRWLGTGALLIGCLFPTSVGNRPAWADESATHRETTIWRRHQDGPLTAEDFRAPLPVSADATVPLSAYTVTEIRYDTRYRVTGSQNRWTARLQSAEAFAVVLRDRSWNRIPLDQMLLDHEQGHFDLCHTFALSAQLRLDELIRSRRAPVGTGTSSAAAISDLDEKLRGELKPIFDRHAQAQMDYDRVTGHGTAKNPQAEQRKSHLERIAKLNEQLQLRNKKGK